jgi:hypothetical protein
MFCPIKLEIGAKENVHAIFWKIILPCVHKIIADLKIGPQYKVKNMIWMHETW